MMTFAYDSTDYLLFILRHNPSPLFKIHPASDMQNLLFSEEKGVKENPLGKT
jgi:hypothetical protein